MTVEPKILTEQFEDYSARLDWRWQRALALFGDDESPVAGFDDPATVKSYRFIKAFQDTETTSQRQLLRMKFPNEVRAHDYYLNSDNRRFKLEAMCLCRDLTAESIAEMLDEAPGVIHLFKQFFFDVHDRKQDAVYNVLFPPNCFKEALGTNLSDKIWKFFAMVGGFRMLNCLINPYTIDQQSSEIFVDLGKRQTGVDYGIGRLIQPLKHRGDLQDLNESILRLTELDIKEREASGNSIPEAQAVILKKCIEATHIQVMDPDYRLDSPYEPTVEEVLARREAEPVPAVA